MKAIAATEKTKIAIRNAYNYLGGDDLSNESTGHMLNGKFDLKKQKKYHPFQLEIKRYPSGATLYMHPGMINIYNDFYKTSKSPSIYELAPIFQLTQLSNGSATPSGIWHIILSLSYEKNAQADYNVYLYASKLGNDTIFSGFNFPTTNGMYSTVIGTIEKRVLSGAYPQSSDPNAYWEIIDQYVTTNLDVYLKDTNKDFSMICSCNKPASSTYQITSSTLSLQDFDIDIRPGALMIENKLQPISGINVLANSFDLNKLYYAYIDIDLNNLSASFVDFYDTNQSPWQDGHYFWYLGKVAINNDPLQILCLSQYNGPVQIPYIIPSGQTILCGNNGELNAIPLSAGFLESVSGSVSGNVTYNIQFTEATECEDEE